MEKKNPSKSKRKPLGEKTYEKKVHLDMSFEEAMKILADKANKNVKEKLAQRKK